MGVHRESIECEAGAKYIALQNEVHQKIPFGTGSFGSCERTGLIMTCDLFDSRCRPGLP